MTELTAERVMVAAIGEGGAGGEKSWGEGVTVEGERKRGYYSVSPLVGV